MRFYPVLLCTLLLWFASVRGLAAADGAPLSIASPNGAVEFTVVPQGDLEFSVTLNGRTAIELSPMHFSVNGTDLARGVKVERLVPTRAFETFPWRGGHSVATNQYRGALVSLRHEASQTRFTLELRAFNDGVAFRYVAPGNDQTRVPNETTRFIIPEGSRVWHHDLGSHYEGEHISSVVNEMPANTWVAPPMTFKLPGDAGYGSITEAGLVNYSGMALQSDGRRGFRTMLAHKQPPSYPFVLRFGTNQAARLSKPAVIKGTIATPWRVVLLASDLNTLVNSDVIPSLCPPPDPRLFPLGMRTDWIKPGRAVWRYLDGGSNTLDGTREFCDLAAKLGFEYNIVQGHWSRWNDDEVRQIVAYARERGVNLFVWKNSRYLRSDQDREAFFQKIHQLGIAGAKVDFFDHEHKEIIDLYDALHETAARHRVLLTFHGCDKPTGLNRTWPNELAREAVRGMDSSRLEDRATHDVVLPFTRMLAGPADYTVVHFGDRRRNTTWAHQVATAVVFNQPLLTYAAHPASLLENPAVELIKTIPPNWEETLVLPPSEIGKIAVYARRTGDTWFVGILNGLEETTLHVPLSFLGNSDYHALLARDAGRGPDALRMENRDVRRADTLIVNLRSGGGFVGRFTRSSLNNP